MGEYRVHVYEALRQRLLNVCFLLFDLTRNTRSRNFKHRSMILTRVGKQMMQAIAFLRKIHILRILQSPTTDQRLPSEALAAPLKTAVAPVAGMLNLSL